MRKISVEGESMMQEVMDLKLNPTLKYDAFIMPFLSDEGDEHVAQRGVVGFVDFYPENAGFRAGKFDPEAWEDDRHNVSISFTPNRQGYRNTIVLLKRQKASVEIIDCADPYGYREFENKVKKLTGK
jgi:hypothetical protein